MNRLAAIAAPLGVVAWMLGSGAAAAKPIPIHATLKPIAHTNSQGSGTLKGSFNPYTHEISWRLTYKTLSSQVISAKIHGPSHPGHDAPVILALPPPLGTPIKGVVVITGGVAAKITGGYAYVVIGTEKHPAGELRGRIRRGP